MRQVIVAKMSSLNGYYAGLGGNVTALPMDASFDDYNRAGLQPQLAKSSRGEFQGIHYVQEDSPAEIGMALREFITTPSKGGDARLTSARSSCQDVRKLLLGHRRDQAATTSPASARSGLCCITPSLKWSLARTA